MNKSKSFNELIVWQKAHEFVLNIYKLTSDFPKSETYGLASQFRRAAVSIPANISEGFVKKVKQINCDSIILHKVQFKNVNIISFCQKI